MTELSAVADELDALVRDGRRIRLGHRNFERPHAELDELVTRLAAAARVVRLVASAPSTPVVTGRGQVLVSVSRSIPGRHVELPSNRGSRTERHSPHSAGGSKDGT
ncbi:hypothetical protein [Methylorubrum sp. POS3]|uniref:hypothetical protein n=1 Tax=Methylorubrum sp. POS3 TaxID=2998492 RepID=UPI003727F6AE